MNQPLQTTLALSAGLVAQNPKLPLLVSAQPVRAQQPAPLLVHCGYRVSASHGRPDQTVNVFYWLDCRRRHTMPFSVLRADGISHSNGRFMTQ